MSDPTPKPPSGGAIAAIIAALHEDARGILSAMLVFFAFFVLIFALGNMPAYFKNLVAAPVVKDQCWDLKEALGMLFKFNKCSGEVSPVEVKHPSPAGASVTKP